MVSLVSRQTRKCHTTKHTNHADSSADSVQRVLVSTNHTNSCLFSGCLVSTILLETSRTWVCTPSGSSPNICQVERTVITSRKFFTPSGCYIAPVKDWSRRLWWRVGYFSTPLSMGQREGNGPLYGSFTGWWPTVTIVLIPRQHNTSPNSLNYLTNRPTLSPSWTIKGSEGFLRNTQPQLKTGWGVTETIYMQWVPMQCALPTIGSKCVQLWMKRESYIAAARNKWCRGSYWQWDHFSWQASHRNPFLR